MFGLITLVLVVVSSFAQTPLDDYIKRPDPAYSWKLNSTITGEFPLAGKWTTYVIDMTSLQWFNDSIVDHSIWKHWLLICVPDKPVEYENFATVVGTGLYVVFLFENSLEKIRMFFIVLIKCTKVFLFSCYKKKGGSWRDGIPDINDEYFRVAQYIATHTKTITAVLYGV